MISYDDMRKIIDHFEKNAPNSKAYFEMDFGTVSAADYEKISKAMATISNQPGVSTLVQTRGY